MREAREYVHAPTALRNRPLPYDAREEFQLEVAVTERERERAVTVTCDHVIGMCQRWSAIREEMLTLSWPTTVVARGELSRVHMN